jgi:hypothetical protein
MFSALANPLLYIVGAVVVLVLWGAVMFLMELRRVVTEDSIERYDDDLVPPHAMR